jgi:hypothetical protein
LLFWPSLIRILGPNLASLVRFAHVKSIAITHRFLRVLHTWPVSVFLVILADPRLDPQRTPFWPFGPLFGPQTPVLTPKPHFGVPGPCFGVPRPHFWVPDPIFGVQTPFLTLQTPFLGPRPPFWGFGLLKPHFWPKFGVFGQFWGSLALDPFKTPSFWGALLDPIWDPFWGSWALLGPHFGPKFDHFHPSGMRKTPFLTIFGKTA